MITKERLEKLIEQGATIYTSGYRESCCFENEIIVDLAKLDYFNKTKIYSIKDFGDDDFVLLTGYTCDNGCDECLTPDELFETLEEAEWHKEFGCIERTERFEPLYYNNIDQNYCYDYYFSAKNHHEYLIRVSGRDIILFWLDCNHKEYFKNTKEEYEKLIRRCKKMFLEGDYAN